MAVGSSAAVSIPLVWIAFDVNSLLIKYQNFRRSGTWQSWQRRQREMFKSANTSVQNLFKKVQRWSNISSSERTGLEPGLVQSVTGKEDLLRAPDSETSGRYSP
ncbi:hypothetical protein BO71DRAFT_15546 [Aspergillus ellipticus CBS 707.79]|uniref:Uncharacterized protein n=1 Tax=Aspergillus ellipticus CBS 707.79 TaxID=1448320 RepID=A0A319D5X5_9EURO|nr:hypothetical protein BO71DRAFT_15546 [Aspergillus ellipticus CBS 707.79]